VADESQDSYTARGSSGGPPLYAGQAMRKAPDPTGIEGAAERRLAKQAVDPASPSHVLSVQPCGFFRSVGFARVASGATRTTATRGADQVGGLSPASVSPMDGMEQRSGRVGRTAGGT
jgi:hypothetical protein